MKPWASQTYQSISMLDFVFCQVIDRKKTASVSGGHRTYKGLVAEAEAGGVPAAAAWWKGVAPHSMCQEDTVPFQTDELITIN